MKSLRESVQFRLASASFPTTHAPHSRMEPVGMIFAGFLLATTTMFIYLLLRP
ncbi:hypothetical protein [Pedosphaera parvula]|uniref:Uncharacterized protein n=1 Tax=Pedosphaera parvula (strain Ellin514) TaxID=320771 RepID=B9XK13_PEDPL|nr:hypothetical protein [Pedosphaera parvula]EEF59836.1 hypothetical protein Cflav_PD2843 [Pedosphaera parvula Ellin514]